MGSRAEAFVTLNVPMPPLVSILIPTRNRAELLKETLFSVRSQTYETWEAIVVDDHSTDDTASVLEMAREQDIRIRPCLRSGTLSGAQVCRNQAMAESRGDYVLFLDSDDLLSTTCLQGRVDVMKENPNLDFAVFQAAMFEKVPEDATWLWNKFTSRSDLERFLDLDAPWGISSPLWRRTTLEALGPLDEELPCWQDWELHTRALLAQCRYVKKDKVDCYVRADSAGHTKISGEAPPGNSFSWIQSLPRMVDAGFDSWTSVPDVLEQRRIGIHYWFAQRLALSNREEALEIWRKFQGHPRVSSWVYRSGVVHLYVRRNRELRFLLYLLRRWTWPKKVFTQFGSKNFHKARVEKTG